jgi:rifampicin phosphotransferase
LTTWILPLHSPDLTLSTAGGKGANLSVLMRGGFQVPGGFVVVTDAYRHFVEANELGTAVSTLLKQMDAADLQAYDRVSADLRRRFAQGDVPEEIRVALFAAYADQIPAGVPVAVRSSATAEDLPNASFAGQQETYLNVSGETALLDAVARCWSSLWTGRAIAYRHRQGITPEEVSLAVVVQQMAPAEVAGVLFTVNPVTGKADQMVINAAWGLGEALVSGRVNPDTFVADKITGKILEHKVGDKAVMVAAAGSGTVEVAVDEAQRSRPALTAEQVAMLVESGRAIEGHFGQSQDVEWAFVGNQLYILQSRPVTAVANPQTGEPPGDDEWPPLLQKPPRPYDLWSQADLGERWPDPLTPFTWSTWQPITEKSMRLSFQDLNEPFLAEIEWIRRAYGRAYLNEGALAYALHEGYGMPASSFAEGMGSVPGLSERYQGWRWITMLRRAPLLIQMLRTWERQIKQFEQDFPQIERWVDEFMQRNLEKNSDAGLWQEAQGLWLDRVETYIRCHSAVTSTSMNAYSQMESLLKRWTGNPELIRSLITGLTGVIQAEIVPALWDLAKAVQRQGLAPLLLENDADAALARLADHPDATPVLSGLANFLQRHGHRCPTEAEWLYPRWIEKPSQVIAQVASYLRAGEGFNPAEAEVRPRQLREETTRQVETKLNLLQRIYFRRALQRLHRLVRMRDNGQHYLVKLALPMRHIYASLGQRWAERGWLERADDFFFLVVPEIEAVIHSDAPQAAGLDLRTISARRRAAWLYWMAQPTFPLALDADGRPLAVESTMDGDVLSGIAGSSGRVEGAARVILDPQEAMDLKPGEILVTRATDPGWTPAFSVIGGLVLEIGGQLSHGAIVAREYGLPAVINVPGATQKIQNGQQIIVDGSAGKVYLSGTQQRLNEKET